MPESNRLPPLAALYQSTVLPPGGVALNVAGNVFAHTVTFDAVGATGFAFTTSTTAVRVALTHPVVVFLDWA